jgi:hypothetical protein
MMNKINTTADLKYAILELEYLQTVSLARLKGRFYIACDKLKPINMIKAKFKELVLAPAAKSNAVNTVIGLATGFIAKKVIVGRTHNPLMKLVGFAVELVVANNVAKNPEGIRSIAEIIFKKFRSEKIYSEKL